MKKSARKPGAQIAILLRFIAPNATELTSDVDGINYGNGKAIYKVYLQGGSLGFLNIHIFVGNPHQGVKNG